MESGDWEMEEQRRRELKEQLKETFYWFHRHPELSYEEYETTKRIREFLEQAGVKVLPCLLETGLVAVIEGRKQGGVQALRCDIDALPVCEESGLSYASAVPGRMHACGHDFHITAGLGCALLLGQRREELSGTVKVIFQPGEESARGALKILEAGAVEDVETVWGFHADPTNEVGVIGIREGYVAAAADRFVIHIKGVGCHGAHPDEGASPIPAAAAIAQALPTIVTGNANAFHPALLSVTRIEAGHTWNVIPERAMLEGTVRTMDREDRSLFERRIREITERIAAAYGVKGEVEWRPGSPAVYNDGELAKDAESAAKSRGLSVVPEECSMGGDDFSFYETGKYGHVRGCYIKIGTGKGAGIHQPDFRVDPEAILPTAEYLTELLLQESLKR